MRLFTVSLFILFSIGNAMAASLDTTPPPGVQSAILGGARFGVSRFGAVPAATFVVTTSVEGGNGSIVCDSPVISGGTSICTITADGGYYLASLTDNGVARLSSVVSGRYTVGGITTTHTVTGIFAPGIPPGTCGSSNKGLFAVKPETGLCIYGTASSVTGTGPWQWTCTGEGGGPPDACFAGTLYKVKILESGTNYPTIQDAYDKVTDGGSVLVQSDSFTEDLSCNRPVRVALLGGCDAFYTGTGGFSVIRGTLSIVSGTVTVRNMLVR